MRIIFFLVIAVQYNNGEIYFAHIYFLCKFDTLFLFFFLYCFLRKYIRMVFVEYITRLFHQQNTAGGVKVFQQSIA
jgi:hypothetical protein